MEGGDIFLKTTISEINNQIANLLKKDDFLKLLNFDGEITNGPSFRNTVFFTMSDNEFSISCVIWNNYLKNIDSDLLKKGKKINVTGKIYPFTKSGKYVIDIRSVKDIGVGNKKEKFELLLKKLQSTGLTERKRALPKFSYRVGIVTSKDGAAITDIQKILSPGNLNDIIIFDAYVQGNKAKESIIQAIKKANYFSEHKEKIDVLIIGRGGGGDADLDVFNDEDVAKAIFNSKIPTISAVGHEKNKSISDFIADVSMPTPTAAANLVLINRPALKDILKDYETNITNSLKIKITNEEQRLNAKKELIIQKIKNKIQYTSYKLDEAKAIILSNNPENIFAKGYSAVFDEHDKPVSTIKNIKLDKEYTIMLKDGQFIAKPLKIK